MNKKRHHMKYILVALGVTLGHNAFSQLIKTYSGAFEKGTASYEYYENDKFERIFNGLFSYKTGRVTLTGVFKDNKKSGTWKAVANIDGFAGSYIDVVNGTYVNGNLDGLCTYTRTSKTTKKVVTKSSLNFIRNVPVGEYKYWSNFNELKIDVSFHLSKEGLLDGIYLVKYTRGEVPFEQIRKYKKGYLYWELHRNLANGEIIKSVDQLKLVDSIIINFDSVKMISIIPKLSFLKGSSLPGSRVNLTSYATKGQFDSDSLYFVDMPITTLTVGLKNNDNSLEELTKAINFWQSMDLDCDHCEGSENVLYFFSKKSYPVELKVASIFVDGKLYDKIQLDNALDELKNSMLSVIEWKSTEDFIISSNSINESQISGFFIYSYCWDKYKRESYDNHSLTLLRKCTEIILSRKTIRTNVGDGINREFGLTPNYSFSKEEAAELASILGLRIASSEQLKLSGKPHSGYYFVKN